MPEPRKRQNAMITLIDNYDSFTYNLFHYLGELGARVRVHRNDKVSIAAVLDDRPEAIVLSPGPCTPNEAGICLGLVKAAAGQVPVLGVCLGHHGAGAQALSLARRAIPSREHRLAAWPRHVEELP
jgi:anthranilate synthase component 2